MRRSLFLLLTMTLAAAAMAKDAEHAFQTVVPRGRVQRVLIDIPHGQFTIRNGSSNQLAAAGIASRDYDGQREAAWARKVVNDTSVEIYISGTEAIVRRKFGKNARSYRAQKFTGIDLRLDLPPGVDIEFDTTAGEIDIAGDFGNVDVDLRAGEIDLRMPKARVRELNVSARVGEVRANLGTQLITREGLFPGRTRYFNAAGTSNVRLHVTAGEVDVRLTQ